MKLKKMRKRRRRMSKILQSYDEDKCPYCDHEDIDWNWSDIECEDKTISISGKCKYCHRKLFAYYTLEFDFVEYEETEEDVEKKEKRLIEEAQKKFEDENQVQINLVSS
jgi:hypothetical protein